MEIRKAFNARRPPVRVPRAQSSKRDSHVNMYNYKNKLQEYAQQTRLELPVYNTVNEGRQHDPKFRCTVKVRNIPYRSPRTFPQKKRAEQDAARIAFESLCPTPKRKVEEYPYPVVSKDATFCKSILSKYAIEMHLDMPLYKTNQVERSLEVPVFVSSVHLNGFNFTGAKAKNKKEAEQLAARVLVLFLLERGDSETISVISEIIKSKFPLYAAVANTKDTNSIFSKARSVVNSQVSTDMVNSMDTCTSQSLDSLPDNTVKKQAANPPLYLCKKARLENPTRVVGPALESVQTLVPSPTEADHEKTDAVVTLTEVTPSVAL